MTSNYTPPKTETNEEEDMFTKAFTAQNNPAEVATSAAQREYSRIIGESRAQERSTQEAYSDMYAKMRQSAFRRQQATPAQGFTGGMAAQQQSALSAAEMAELGALGRSQEQSLRDIRTGRLSAFSNALIAGQQQADYASMLQDRTFARQQQIEAIVADEQTSNEAKQRLLKTLGISDSEIKTILGIEDDETQSVGASMRTAAEARRGTGAATGNFGVPSIEELKRLGIIEE